MTAAERKLLALLRKQKKMLREVLTEVKVRHLNRHLILPVATQALIENTLLETAGEEVTRVQKP